VHSRPPGQPPEMQVDESVLAVLVKSQVVRAQIRPDVLRNEGKEGKEGGSLRRAGFRKWEGSEKGRREGGTNQLSGTSKVFSWPGEASQPVGASGVEPEPVKRAGH
jgi:hypothetical protein